MSLKILACQIDIPTMTTAAHREKHLYRTVSLVDQKLTIKPVDLVVLPELSSIDYSREAFANLHVLAEPPEGDSFSKWRALALKHQCWVVYGFACRSEAGCSIATAMVNPAGDLAGVYHKLHLAQFGDSMEKEYFTAGPQQLLVAQIKGFRVAPIICYDIRAPELCRTLAILHGVDLILHTGAYARDPSFYSWHAFAATRAIENQIYLLSLNRAGQHFGRSVFCSPWMDESHPPATFEEHGEHCKIVVLSVSELVKARSDYTFLKDRLASYDIPTQVVGS